MGGIVWLASYPKSGNTWARNFLHNLLRPKAESHDINDMNALTAYENVAHWFKPLLSRPLEQCSSNDVAQVRSRAQEALAAAAPGLVFVKTHNALVHNFGRPVIHGRVTAGAIYIVRNPLDVAISFAHHLNSTVDIAIARMNTGGLVVPNSKQTAYEVYGSWSENVLSWTRKPSQGLHVMRYEDMIERPEPIFRALCTFLLIDSSRAQLLEAIEKSSFERLKEQESRIGFAEKSPEAESFFREGRAGAWRDRLSKPQIEAILAAHREQMARFDYLPAAS